MIKRLILFICFAILLTTCSSARMTSLFYGGQPATPAGGGDCATTYCIDIDTAGAGGDIEYASLAAAIAAETATAGSGETITFRCQASGGAADTTAVTITGYTADLVTLTQIDFPSDGIFSASVYRLQASDALSIQQANVDIDKFQIDMNGASYADHGVTYDVFGAVWNNNIDKLIVKGSGGAANDQQGIDILRSNAGSVITITNSIITDWTGNLAAGILANDVDVTVNITNVTIYNCLNGIIVTNSATVNIKNSAILNNTDDINGTVTSSYTATDDGDSGTGNVTISQSADDWAALVTDAAGEDFSVTNASSELYTAGTNTGAPSDDIIDTLRPQNTTTDIGAYEDL